MSSYDALAGSYDSLMTDASHVKRAAFLVKRFGESAIPVRTVLDLACGTGTIACLLAEKGYTVTATDGSGRRSPGGWRPRARRFRPFPSCT